MDVQKILRAQGVVFLMVVVGVGLFVLIYGLAGGLPDATRLFMSLCLPPLIMGVVFGFLVLYLRMKQP